MSCPFTEPLTLQEISCLSPLAGALLLPLEDLEEPCAAFPIPLKAGNVSVAFYFCNTPDPAAAALCDSRIATTGHWIWKRKNIFRADTRDTHAIYLKKLGYAFNDLLKEEHHPLLLERTNLLTTRFASSLESTEATERKSSSSLCEPLLRAYNSSFSL